MSLSMKQTSSSPLWPYLHRIGSWRVGGRVWLFLHRNRLWVIASRHRMYSHHASPPDSWETERIVFVSELLTSHTRRLTSSIGTEFAGDDSPISIHIGSTLQSSQKMVREQPMLAFVIRMGFLQISIAHHPHLHIFSGLADRRFPGRRRDVDKSGAGRRVHRNVKHQNSPPDR